MKFFNSQLTRYQPIRFRIPKRILIQKEKKEKKTLQRVSTKILGTDKTTTTCVIKLILFWLNILHVVRQVALRCYEQDAYRQVLPKHEQYAVTRLNHFTSNEF